MLLVVGGHSRNIGKTSVAAGLVRKLSKLKWTALKIEQVGRGMCTESERACDCGPEQDHAYSLIEEYERGPGDSGRMLAAGAVRSFWLRASAGRLFEAADTIRRIVDQSENTIIESNSVLEYFDPDLFLMVLDFACDDFKDSSLRYLDRADAFVVVDRGAGTPVWQAMTAGLWESKPQFAVKPPSYVTPALAEFVRTGKVADAVPAR